MSEIPDNVVIVGKKPIQSYLLAIANHVANGMNEIIVKAMGRNISKAVDVVNRSLRGIANSYKISDVNIDTAELELEDGKKKYVSTIEIKLKK